MQNLFNLASKPAVVRRAVTMALIVGLVIGLLNHGDKMFAGLMTPGDWLKVGLTFFIPYTVSTVSSVLAHRDQEKMLASFADCVQPKGTNQAAHPLNSARESSSLNQGDRSLPLVEEERKPRGT